MEYPTPTNASDEKVDAIQNGSEGGDVVEVKEETPNIDAINLEGSGGFRGSPDTVNATVTYTTDSDGVVDQQSTIVLSIDDENIAHIKEIEGDGTMVEWFIPIMFLKQELSQHHPSIEDIAGVPSFGVVNEQLYDNQPQFNGDQQQLEDGSQPPSNPEQSLPDENNSNTGVQDGESAPSDQRAATNGAGTTKNDSEQSQPDGESTESVNTTGGVDSSDDSDPKSEQEQTQEEESESVDEPESSDFGFSAEMLIESEDSEWVIDDTSEREGVVATIKHESKDISITVWDFREKQQPEGDYGITYYQAGENKSIAFNESEDVFEQVKTWKVDPPKVS